MTDIKALFTLIFSLVALFLTPINHASMSSHSQNFASSSKSTNVAICALRKNVESKNPCLVWLVISSEGTSGIGVNYYSYVGGNAVNRTDPTGYKPGDKGLPESYVELIYAASDVLGSFSPGHIAIGIRLDGEYKVYTFTVGDTKPSVKDLYPAIDIENIHFMSMHDWRDITFNVLNPEHVDPKKVADYLLPPKFSS